jgi:hypothetical protein
MDGTNQIHYIQMYVHMYICMYFSSKIGLVRKIIVCPKDIHGYIEECLPGQIWNRSKVSDITLEGPSNQLTEFTHLQICVTQ